MKLLWGCCGAEWAVAVLLGAADILGCTESVGRVDTPTFLLNITYGDLGVAAVVSPPRSS